METTKQKIDEIIKDYKDSEIFKPEWEAFKRSRRLKKNLQVDDYSTFQGKEGAIERGLTEIPATLHTIMKRHLNEEQYKWYESLKGKKWLAKKYKEFAMSEKV